MQLCQPSYGDISFLLRVLVKGEKKCLEQVQGVTSER